MPSRRTLRSISESALLLLFALPPVADLAHAEQLQVTVRGVDDGIPTTPQKDRDEAELDAMRQAVERAGVDISAVTEMDMFELKRDFITSTADAVLLPGYSMEDIGYQKDGTYLVVLSGKVNVERASSGAGGGTEKASLVYLKLDNDSSFLKDQLEDELRAIGITPRYSAISDGQAIPTFYVRSRISENEVFRETIVNARVVVRIENEHGTTVFNDDYKIAGSSYVGFDEALDKAREELMFQLDQTGALATIGDM